MSETVTINGITYEVKLSRTVEQTENDGHHNTARFMREQGAIRELYLKRPSGRLMFAVTEFMSRDGGTVFGRVARIGSW